MNKIFPTISLEIVIDNDDCTVICQSVDCNWHISPSSDKMMCSPFYGGLAPSYGI